MKKYWKTLLISLVIVTTIGSYYIQSAMASKSGVSFNIETISGNKEEIENLQLQATYESGDMYQELYISKDGSTDKGRSSIIEELTAYRVPSEFEKYIQEHRNFMRGKVFNLGQYFEDEERLIYATFPQNNREVIKGKTLTLGIDRLDKHTNDSTSFEVNIPAKESYSWMDVEDVYVGNGEMKILVTGYLINGGEESRIYKVDANQKEVVDDILFTKSTPGMTSIRIYNDFQKVQNEDYYLYKEGEYIHRIEDGDSDILPSKMYLYNNSTDEVEELVIPSDLNPFSDSIRIQGVECFIPIYSAKGIELNRYNIEKKQWEEPLYLDYPSTFNDEEEPFLEITDGKLYLVNRDSDGYRLFIGDLRTGQSLYEGKIINENSEKQHTDIELYFHRLNNIN